MALAISYDENGTAAGDDAVYPLHAPIDVLMQYLERSNDVEMAVSCLATFVNLGLTLDDKQQTSGTAVVLLHAISVALNIVRNRPHKISASLRGSLCAFLHPSDIAPLPVPGCSADIELAFATALARSACAFSLVSTPQNDAFEGLVFDTASIVLSLSKYNVCRFQHTSHQDS
jgi:hypothetical protein